jgi:L-ascorbate metabolism protein UlaG (beta-lactamase superfamily)
MMRYLAALAAGLLAAGAAPAADDAPKEVHITWHGQSFFEIVSSKGTRIVIDPHMIPEYGKITGVKADAILMSHLHNDHTQKEVVENWQKAKLIEGLKAKGRQTDWNAIDEQIKDVHVRSVATYHDKTQGMERGKNTIFILEMDGIRIVHLGDLGHMLSAAQIKNIGPVDVLMVPVGGVYTLNGSEAKKVVKDLKPRKYVIPMHYGTPVYDDLLPADEFLEDQKKEVVARSLENHIGVKVNYKPPEPIIVLLHWDSTFAKKPRPKR